MKDEVSPVPHHSTIAHVGPVVRCKMRVNSVKHVKNADGSTENEEVQLMAVYGDTPENKEWSKWTPSASFMITINNPGAFGKLSSGHEFFVDFTPCPKPEAKTGCCGGNTQCCKK